MITELGLVVALWIVWGGESVGDLIFCTEACYLLADEVYPIIRDDSMREPKATYNVLPKKFDYLLSCDIRKLHRFHPLGEVACGY